MGELGRNARTGRRLWLALVALGALACTNTPNNIVTYDASHPADRPVDHPADHPHTDAAGRSDVAPDAAGFECDWPEALANGAVTGCAPFRAFVTCATPGSSASYAASDPKGCLSCSGTCTDSCALGEFALSCHDAPPDGAVSSGPAHGCRFAAEFLAGSVVYCCPCQ
jgi:hypothetical protein